MQKHAAFARKSNFWSEQRVKHELKIGEVASMLGLGEKIMGMYFSGQSMPSDDVVKQICDMFDVPFEKGQLEFQHAHNTWKAEHSATLTYSSKKKKKIKPANINTIEDVLKVLYGELSCADFIAIYDFIKMDNVTGIDPLEILYGKVDFETYQKIIELF